MCISWIGHISKDSNPLLTSSFYHWYLGTWANLLIWHALRAMEYLNDDEDSVKQRNSQQACFNINDSWRKIDECSLVQSREDHLSSQFVLSNQSSMSPLPEMNSISVISKDIDLSIKQPQFDQGDRYPDWDLIMDSTSHYKRFIILRTQITTNQFRSGVMKTLKLHRSEYRERCIPWCSESLHYSLHSSLLPQLTMWVLECTLHL